MDVKPYSVTPPIITCCRSFDSREGAPQGAYSGAAAPAALQVTKRSSWRQFVDSLDEPTNQMSDILAWFNSASAGGQLQGAAGGAPARARHAVARV
jgi:hypothetical protein